MDLFNLFAKISLDSTEYNKGVTDADSKGRKLASALGSGLKTAGKIGAAALGAITAAAGAATVALAKGVQETAAYGDNIDKMSQKMGISATAYQEWDAVMQHSGTSMETLKSGMKTLANAVESGNAAFERIGITQDQIASMSQEELFSATIAGLQNVESETERTYIAGQLLGKGATELGALLNMSAEETEAMKSRVHELGGVMSDEAVKAAAAFQDNLQDLQTSISGIKRGITGAFLPGVNDVLAGFTSMIIGEEGAEEKMTSGLDSIFNTVGELMPKIESLITNIGGALVKQVPNIIRIGIGLVKTIAQGISENTDVLVNSVFEIVDFIADELTSPDGLLTIIDAALDIVLKLADGLTQNLPKLLPAVVDVIMTIVDKLTDPDMLDQLVQAALDLIIALAEGLIGAQNKLIEKAPVIIGNLVEAVIRAAPRLLLAAAELIVVLVRGIVEKFGTIIQTGKDIVDKVKNGFKQKVEDAKNWGAELITGFINGIKEKWENLKQSVANVVNSVKSIFTGKSGFDEHSPSKWARDVFENVMSGAEIGLDRGESGLIKQTQSVVHDVQDEFDNSYAGGRSRIATEILAILQQYLPQLANVDIRLDSGVLVGELTPGIDAQLGTRQGYAQRGAAVV